MRDLRLAPGLKTRVLGRALFLATLNRVAKLLPGCGRGVNAQRLSRDLRGSLTDRRGKRGGSARPEDALEREAVADEVAFGIRAAHEGQAEWKAATVSDGNRQARRSSHGGDPVARADEVVAEDVVGRPGGRDRRCHHGVELLALEDREQAVRAGQA